MRSLRGGRETERQVQFLRRCAGPIAAV